MVHGVFGLSWGEIATIIGIIGTLTGGFVWLLNKGLLEPQKFTIEKLNEAVDKLTKAVDKLNEQTDNIHTRISNVKADVAALEAKQEAFEYHIQDMDKQINILFKNNGLERKEDE